MQHRNCTLTMLIRVAVVVLCLSPIAQGSILLSDLVVDLEVPRGKSLTTTLDVTNAGTLDEFITVTYLDWEADAVGDHTFLQAGALARSLSPDLHFSPAAFHLAPGETQQVRITVTSPAQASGTYWGLLMVEGQDDVQNQGADGVTVQIRTRYGVKIYNTVPQTKEPAGRITRMHLVSSDLDASLSVVMQFQNLGNVKVVPAGWFEVRNIRGETLWRAEFTSRTVLPDATVEIARLYDGPTLTPGQYVLLGIVDYGGPRLLGGQVAIRLE